MGAAFSALNDMLAAQRDRWILWLPAGVVAGAAAWLAAPSEPPAFAAPVAFIAAGALAIALALWPSGGEAAWRWRKLGAGAAALIAAIAFGATCAEARAGLVAAPRIAHETGPVRIEGWVEKTAAGEPRLRLTLLVRSIEGLSEPPRFVRVAAPGRFTTGRAVRCLASLRPPVGPLAPGAYDFARRAYFARIGASGFTYGACRPIDVPAPALFYDRARLKLGAVRSDLAEFIYAAAPGRGGAVAASLVTGDRSLISEAVDEDLRDSGLGHILSVSGLHMGVLGGFMFALLSGFFALIPPLALRVPVRKLAAAGALFTLTLYLVISGASVPSIRAYVMAAIVFGAVLIDRPAITMRGLALAAIIIVMALPESVLAPGFQMSFAATAALVAAFEARPRPDWERMLPTPGPIVGALQAFARLMGGALLVSFVAGLAVDPFALFHFQRFAVYGLPANLVAAPLVGFVIAPAAVAAALAAPFGLAEFPLRVMADACDLLIGVGASFADRPEAVRAMPKPPDAAFLLAACAIVWACLWRGWLKAGAIALIAAAIAVYALAPRPFLWFDAELRAVVAREEPTWTLTRAYGRSTFAIERLGQMAGLAPAQSLELPTPQACSESACALRTPRGRSVRIVLTPEGFVRGGDIVLTRLRAPADALGANIIDAADLAAHGGGYVVDAPDGLRIVRVHTPGVVRVWTPES